MAAGLAGNGALSAVGGAAPGAPLRSLALPANAFATARGGVRHSHRRLEFVARIVERRGVLLVHREGGVADRPLLAHCLV